MSFCTSERNSVPIDRRQLFSYLGAASLGLVAAPAVIGRAVAQAPRWTADPFSLGVASGGPRPDGFVLWTRLAPDPLSANPATPGGMTGGDVPVVYEKAMKRWATSSAAALPRPKRPMGGRCTSMFPACCRVARIGTAS
jgi:phosphodiesterase/alkaline phosphatase D-like protein